MEAKKNIESIEAMAALKRLVDSEDRPTIEIVKMADNVYMVYRNTGLCGHGATLSAALMSASPAELSMDAQGILDAMRKYSLTLRRLPEIDRDGRRREPGWLCKVTGGYNAVIRWSLKEDHFGKTPAEAIMKAIRSLENHGKE